MKKININQTTNTIENIQPSLDKLTFDKLPTLLKENIHKSVITIFDTDWQNVYINDCYPFISSYTKDEYIPMQASFQWFPTNAEDPSNYDEEDEFVAGMYNNPNKTIELPEYLLPYLKPTLLIKPNIIDKCAAGYEKIDYTSYSDIPTVSANGNPSMYGSLGQWSYYMYGINYIPHNPAIYSDYTVTQGTYIYPGRCYSLYYKNTYIINYNGYSHILDGCDVVIEQDRTYFYTWHYYGAPTGWVWEQSSYITHLKLFMSYLSTRGRYLYYEGKETTNKYWDDYQEFPDGEIISITEDSVTWKGDIFERYYTYTENIDYTDPVHPVTSYLLNEDDIVTTRLKNQIYTTYAYNTSPPVTYYYADTDVYDSPGWHNCGFAGGGTTTSFEPGIRYFFPFYDSDKKYSITVDEVSTYDENNYLLFPYSNVNDLDINTITMREGGTQIKPVPHHFGGHESFSLAKISEKNGIGKYEVYYSSQILFLRKPGTSEDYVNKGDWVQTIRTYTKTYDAGLLKYIFNLTNTTTTSVSGSNDYYVPGSYDENYGYCQVKLKIDLINPFCYKEGKLYIKKEL